MPLGADTPVLVERREAKGFWGRLSTVVSVMNSDWSGWESLPLRFLGNSITRELTGPGAVSFVPGL